MKRIALYKKQECKTKISFACTLCIFQWSLLEDKHESYVFPKVLEKYIVFFNMRWEINLPPVSKELSELCM